MANRNLLSDFSKSDLLVFALAISVFLILQLRPLFSLFKPIENETMTFIDEKSSNQLTPSPTTLIENPESTDSSEIIDLGSTGTPSSIPNNQEQESSADRFACPLPKPEVCTMECIVNPPFICGSNGKSYCNNCIACSDPEVDWYVVQTEPCSDLLPSL